VEGKFPHVSELQQLHVSIARERAKQSNLEVKSLVLDLRQGGEDRIWRDDGMLPDSSASTHGACQRARRSGLGRATSAEGSQLPVRGSAGGCRGLGKGAEKKRKKMTMVITLYFLG